MPKERVSTADYTIPSLRSTSKAIKKKPIQQLQKQPPSSQKYSGSEAAAPATEDEGTIRGSKGKKSDVGQQSGSSNILSISSQQSRSKLQQQQESSMSIQGQSTKSPAATGILSKDQLKTAEHVQPPPPQPGQQQSTAATQNPNQQLQQVQQQQSQLPTDPTQKSSAPTQATTTAIKQKPKNSVSPPPPLSPSTQKSIQNNNNYIKSGSYIKVDSAYKRAKASPAFVPRNSRSRSNTTRDVASLDTAISESSLKPSTQSTKTCIELDEKRIVTKVNLNSKKAPQIFCFNIRWILLLWGLLLCCYDSTMLMTNIFNTVVFLKFTYHYIFILTFPSGPALFYLMISEKVSIFCWKTHISCQIFRVIMNIYLFLDYYFAWLDSLEELTQFVQIQYSDHVEINQIPVNSKPEIEKQIRTYFAVFLSLLGFVTVLTIIMFGFAINLYYYEKEALKRKQEKWRNRINKILESHQTFVPPETEEMSSDIASSTKYSYVSKK